MFSCTKINSFRNIIMLFRDYCHSEKVIFSLFLKLVLTHFKFIPSEFKYCRDSNGLKIHYLTPTKVDAKIHSKGIFFIHWGIALFCLWTPLRTKDRNPTWHSYAKSNPTFFVEIREVLQKAGGTLVRIHWLLFLWLVCSLLVHYTPKFSCRVQVGHKTKLLRPTCTLFFLSWNWYFSFSLTFFMASTTLREQRGSNGHGNRSSRREDNNQL